MTPQAVAAEIKRRATGPERFLTALAGPPGAGKSTLAAQLVDALGAGAKAVPMDGFHYDDAVLTARRMRDRKGAPDTFDVPGFLHLLRRLRCEADVAIPIFDRTLEISRAGAQVVTAADRLLVIEGNYLLLNEVPWVEAAALFDLTVWIAVPECELVRRLQVRWAQHGKTPAAAQAWIDGNDLPNIRQVVAGSKPADLTLNWE